MKVLSANGLKVPQSKDFKAQGAKLCKSANNTCYRLVIFLKVHECHYFTPVELGSMNPKKKKRLCVI